MEKKSDIEAISQLAKGRWPLLEVWDPSIVDTVNFWLQQLINIYQYQYLVVLAGDCPMLVLFHLHAREATSCTGAHRPRHNGYFAMQRIININIYAFQLMMS